MPLTNPFLGTETKAKEPINEDLMDQKIRVNLENLQTQVDGLATGSGGGAEVGASKFADIIAGGLDNVARHWKRRYHIFENTLDNQSNDFKADFEQKELSDRFIFDPSYGNVGVAVVNGESYKSYFRRVENGEKVQFRIKKGENFFSIGEVVSTGPNSINWTVSVDGVNANTYGLVDQEGATVAASFNSNQTTKWGFTRHFYGLDGEEHVITIENADSGEIALQYVDVGYRSEDFAIDHTIKIGAGRANVGGTEVNFNEGSFSFSKPGEGLSQGYTGMLKIDDTGTVTAVDGLSPAKTEVKPRTTLAFSGTVSSVPVKNHFQFPDNGICLLQNPHGDSYMFSYSSKGDPGGPQNHSLDGTVWQSQPDEDIEYLRDHTPASGIGEFYGDGRIEYWAKAPILIDSSNNRIDFEITVNGTTTLHAATLTNGYYSSDLVPLGKAIEEACQAVKPIKGRYEAFYDNESQLWWLGVIDDEVSQIDFLWSSGINAVSSLGPTIGQSADQTGATSYRMSTEVQHMAQRVFVADVENRSALHMSIKKSWVRSSDSEETHLNQICEDGGFATYINQNTSGSKMIQIYPDEDCMGMTLYFPQEDENTYFAYAVDDGDYIYLGRPSRQGDLNIPTFTSVHSFFISLPKGSSKVDIVRMFGNEYEIDNISPKFTFLGYRQYFTKPPWEGLAKNERVLKTFEVSPIRLFQTRYGHNGGLYTPQPADDNINNITEVGTWNQEVTTSIWNRSRRWTSGLDAYVEIEFTLQGDGGGIALGDYIASTAYSREVEVYLSDTAINESTDLIEMYGQAYSEAVLYGTELFRHLGLKAGTYFCRIKNKESGLQVTNNYIGIIDTVAPQPGAHVASDLNNTNQGIAYPIYARRRNCGRYGQVRHFSFQPDAEYKPGMVSHMDYAVASHTNIGDDFTTNLYIYRDQYWNALLASTSGHYFRYHTHCRSIGALSNFFSAYNTAVANSLDARALSNTNLQQQTKLGLAPSTTRTDAAPSVHFDFEFACTFNAGLTYNITDTRGIRDGQKAILVDNTGATEEVYITNLVTDTSFDIKEALSVLTPANVVKVLFWGFHSLEQSISSTATFYNSAFIFEPLPIEESILRDRLNPVWKTYYKDETSTQSVVLNAGVSSTLELAIPIFENGEVPSPFRMNYQNEVFSVSTVSNEIQLTGFNQFRPAATMRQGSGASTNTQTWIAKAKKVVNDNWPRILRG